MCLLSFRRKKNRIIAFFVTNYHSFIPFNCLMGELILHQPPLVHTKIRCSLQANLQHHYSLEISSQKQQHQTHSTNGGCPPVSHTAPYPALSCWWLLLDAQSPTRTALSLGSCRGQILPPLWAPTPLAVRADETNRIIAKFVVFDLIIKPLSWQKMWNKR